MENQKLRELQLVELEILTVVDAFCREHGINYSLYAGTALGAVRHGGFIPWDDDIDICMERNAYLRFLESWRESPVQGYTLVGDDEPGCHINHTKVFKDNTVLSFNGEAEASGHQGVFLDIFALDKVPSNKKVIKKFIRKAKLRVVYTRDYTYTIGSKLLELASRLLLFKTKKHKAKLRRRLEEYVQQYKDMQDGYLYIGLESPDMLQFFYPADILETCEIEFEGRKFFITKKSHEMLTTMFGDYMQLPPEEERVCKHNPEMAYLEAEHQ